MGEYGCACICQSINDFEVATAAALEPHGLGQDLTGLVLSHVCLLDRFHDHRPALLQALSCKIVHETSVLLKKFNVLGNAKEMLLLFTLCLQHGNDASASRLLPYLGNLQHSSVQKTRSLKIVSASGFSLTILSPIFLQKKRSTLFL